MNNMPDGTTQADHDRDAENLGDQTPIPYGPRLNLVEALKHPLIDPTPGPEPLPPWVEVVKYEYDLDMATRCEMCDAQLIEGSDVLKDTEIKNTYYCKVACAQENGPLTPEQK